MVVSTPTLQYRLKVLLCALATLLLVLVKYSYFARREERYIDNSFANEGYDKQLHRGTHHQSPYWITVRTDRYPSRLGNNMYQYAALKAIARLNNHRHAFITTPKFFRIMEFFDLDLPVNDNIEWGKWEEVPSKTLDVKWTLNVTRKLPEANITLEGQFQSYRFFDELKDEVRKEFSFKDPIKNAAYKFLKDSTPEKWKGKEVVQVGIHIRRTDHISKDYRKQGFFFPSDSYFQTAMAYFVDRFPRVQFIVTSDDIVWCEDFFSNYDHEVVISRNNSDGVDLAVLTLCDHVIITIGTFGWWAGWLNKGVTIYMGDFPVKGTWAGRAYRPGYYIPPEDQYNTWVGIPSLK